MTSDAVGPNWNHSINKIRNVLEKIRRGHLSASGAADLRIFEGEKHIFCKLGEPTEMNAT